MEFHLNGFRPGDPEKVSDYWQFRQRSVTNVRVCLRRIIGHLLVGQEL
jgi:hypothetical protein